VATDVPATCRPMELWIAEGADGVFAQSRITPIRNAQDALTHKEEAVYDALWGKPSSAVEPSRLVKIGYRDLGEKSRVARRTLVRLVDRLIEKGFISIEAKADAATITPTTYRVLSYASIRKFQRESGRHWVLRTGTGVFYARRLEPVASSSLATDD